MPAASRPVTLTVLAALSVAGCGGDEPEALGDGRGALGGSARTKTLARAEFERPPRGEAAWVAHEFRLGRGQKLRHSHGVGFVYGRRGRHRVGGRALAAGEGAALATGAPHVHAAASEDARFWEIRLAAPESSPPRGAKRRVFASEPLRGVPDAPRASFIEVVLPPRGGRTTVHTHPGPEFIYQLTGEIQYQNDMVGTKPLGAGGAEAIPPNTAVQKRNRSVRPASFLSWFLVDPDAPFAPEARFTRR